LNRQIARTIVEHANIGVNDTVLEIGPGLGVLTTILVRTGAKIILIEIEPGLVRALRDLFEKTENIKIIQGDALKVDLPAVNKIVSNLPYNVASQITFRLLSELDFQCAVMMYQKEFADRLLASPGDSQFSRVSVNFQYQATAEKIMDVDAEEFYPVPAVDSTVLKIKPRESGPRAKDDGIFDAVVRGVFSYPNKYLRNAMGIWLRNLGEPEELTDEILGHVDEALAETRPRNLKISQIIDLADILFRLRQEGKIDSLNGV
jgi:16S rRNA (adenine1518-N6/adenine1519-N6)-dimethyltransferase